jgi:hypothetical protein
VKSARRASAASTVLRCSRSAHWGSVAARYGDADGNARPSSRLEWDDPRPLVMVRSGGRLGVRAGYFHSGDNLQFDRSAASTGSPWTTAPSSREPFRRWTRPRVLKLLAVAGLVSREPDARSRRGRAAMRTCLIEAAGARPPSDCASGVPEASAATCDQWWAVGAPRGLPAERDRSPLRRRRRV